MIITYTNFVISNRLISITEKKQKRASNTLKFLSFKQPLDKYTREKSTKKTKYFKKLKKKHLLSKNNFAKVSEKLISENQFTE